MDIDIKIEADEEWTCIGSILVDVASSLAFGAASKQLDLMFDNNVIKIISRGKHRKWQGIVNKSASTFLYPFLESNQVTYEAYLPDKAWISISSSCEDPKLVLDLYVKMGDEKDIGRMLGHNDLYLQDPYKNYRNKEYLNPQELQVSVAALELLLAEGFDFEGSQDDTAVASRPLSEVGLLQREDEVSELFSSSSATEVDALETMHEISHRIVTELKRHQVEGVHWMLRKESASETSKPADMKGGILADDMGMGKTLSMLALILTAADSCDGAGTPITKSKQTTLIICPKSVMTSWEEQIQLHTYNTAYLIMDPINWQKRHHRFGEYDIVISSYGQVSQRKSKLSAAIAAFTFQRIILDEAHIIRERNTERAQAIFALKAEYKWCITGTPVQNKLDDFGSLLEFVQHSKYGTRKTFQKAIIKPLLSHDPIALPKLKRLISQTTLRRLKINERLGLPAREDKVLKLTFNDFEKNIHDLLHTFTRNQMEKALSEGSKGASMGFYMTQLILRLRQVCNHGIDLLPVTLREELMRLDSEGSTEEAIQITFNRMICEVCSGSGANIHDKGFYYDSEDIMERDKLVSFEDNVTSRFDCQHVICQNCNTEEGECPLCFSTIEDDTAPLQPSTKVQALIQNLKTSSLFTKSVVFSCWTKMLDLIQKPLIQEGISFIRMDGSLDLQTRRERVDQFRNDPRCRVLISSLGTGSVGLDLTVASHVHLLEPHFNPMLEEQALARVHRIGQTLPVTTIRYIMEGSYEEEMLERQTQKLQLAELCASGTLRSHRHLVKSIEILGTKNLAQDIIVK